MNSLIAITMFEMSSQIKLRIILNKLSDSINYCLELIV